MKKRGLDVSQATQKFRKDKRILIEAAKRHIENGSSGVILLRDFEATIGEFVGMVQHTAASKGLAIFMDFESALDIVEIVFNKMLADRTLRLAHQPGDGRLELRRLVFFPPKAKKFRKKVRDEYF